MKCFDFFHFKITSFLISWYFYIILIIWNWNETEFLDPKMKPYIGVLKAFLQWGFVLQAALLPALGKGTTSHPPETQSSVGTRKKLLFCHCILEKHMAVQIHCIKTYLMALSTQKWVQSLGFGGKKSTKIIYSKSQSLFIFFKVDSSETLLMRGFSVSYTNTLQTLCQTHNVHKRSIKLAARIGCLPSIVRCFETCYFTFCSGIFCWG